MTYFRSVTGITLIVLSVGLIAPALAQNPPIQATELPPLQEQSRPANTPPPLLAPPPLSPPSADPTGQGLYQAPAAPNPTPAIQSQAPATPGEAPASPPATTERPNVWVPAQVAKLQALDKVNDQASDLTIKVGQSATFGSLTITVKSCVVRPPDQPVDAAAYLDITDSHQDQPGFDGWMLRDEPSVSMMQHPIYDLRVSGCT